ncbi:hypothetical protein B9K06_12555 [Bacillus sp. OG2]|nr:hypothetical protein B9K06_12555 [Bacillus sp. OG2]
MVFYEGLALTISATVGTLLYFAIDFWVLITLLAMVLMLILLRIVGSRLPAVFGFPLLPFVFPDEIVARLPIGTLVTSVFFFSFVLLFKKVEMKLNKKKLNYRSRSIK